MSNHNTGNQPDSTTARTDAPLAQNGLVEQANGLADQLKIRQEENNGLVEQLQLSSTEQLFLETKLAEIKRLLAQLAEDRQALVEECYAAETELHQLIKRRHKSQRNLAALNQQMRKEKIDQQQTNRELASENRKLVSKGDQLKLVKQDLEEHNLGLVEDINLLEEIAEGLEAHAAELTEAAALLRQKNTQLREQNRLLRAEPEESK